MRQANLASNPDTHAIDRKMVVEEMALLPPLVTDMADGKHTTGNGAKETFAARLARLRKAAGYSQREFADEIGVSNRVVAYYEAQTEYPPSHLLPRIAKALGVSTDQLLGLEPIGKRRPPLNRRLLEKLQQIEALRPRDQAPLLRMIDGYIKNVQSS